MAYKLKKNQPDFDVVDGPFTGKKYRHNESYEEVPPGDKHRFEVVRKAAPAPLPQGGTAAKSATQPAGKKNGGSEAKKSTAVKSKGGTSK